MENQSFDYIVTGAGSAGCAVAGRLSENGKHSVLLLEAGPQDTNFWIHVPLGFTKVFTDERVNWCFDSEPVPELNNRSLYQPRGKVLGGTSSINGMVYMRGTPSDYDNWRQRGCTGWDWDSVLPFFKKAQDQTRGPDALHGVGGPLTVSDIPKPWMLPTRIIEAATQAGIPRNDDFNGMTQEGTGFYQFTAKDSRRWSSARAYLKDAKKRHNLHIVTSAHATRILLEDRVAVGVEYQTPEGPRVAYARAEVVVCGGAFGSPHLLQLSGIGPSDVLREVGIDVVHDAHEVGENLHDHFNTYLSYRCNQPITLNDLAKSRAKQWLAGAQYVLTRTGLLSNTGVYAGAFVRSDPRFEQPDLQINMLAWSSAERRRTGVVPHPFSAFSLSPVHLRPEGRGHVRVKSPDPHTAPSIQFKFLTNDYDRDAIVYGMRLCREIARQPALNDLIVEEVLPGAATQSDEELLEDVRERAVANYHPVGTCRMGADPNAVVDPRLRVQGVGKLRVADASIMPQIIAGNTNAPSIMIGEKAASMVLEDNR
ncbi:MAG: choline dehydrogenase [Gammaproteobacteria bacterium]|nr:choline dehydrogenase [Gammaproteobacteria bacterium]